MLVRSVDRSGSADFTVGCVLRSDTGVAALAGSGIVAAGQATAQSGAQLMAQQSIWSCPLPMPDAAMGQSGVGMA